MKEASGEANLTVIAIILIAVIAAVVTPIINSTMTTSAKKTCCSNFGGTWRSNRCQTVNANGTFSDVNEASYWDSDEKTCK